MRPHRFYLPLLFAGNLCAQSATDRCTVHFAADADRLDAVNLRELERFATTLDAGRELTILIEGHTDLDGRNAYNEALASRRAEAVRTRLVEAGMPRSAITLRAFGERRPVAFGEGDEEKERNRRVEVSCTYTTLTGIDALEQALGGDERTRATIDPARVNYVAGQNGTVVRIPAGVLTDADGNTARGNVEITLTEALSVDRMITSRLSTSAKGRLLETGGMMRIEARDSRGRELRLRDGDSLLVALPTDAQQPGMRLFTSSDGSDWSDTGKEPLPPMPKMELPKAPLMIWPTCARPRFKEDLSLRPRRPVGPARPEPPLPPRRESYSTTPRWYQFYKHARLRAGDELNYREAMERHADRVAKYEERLRRYEEECLKYPEARKRYIADSIAYQQNLVVRMDEFGLTVVAQADSGYTQAVRTANTRYQARLKDWRERCDAYMRSYGDRLDSLGLASTTDQLSNYVFAVNNVGWINCDRFMTVPQEQKRELIVQDPDATDERVYLVFKNINSLIALQNDGQGRYVGSNVPRNEPAELVAYKVADGKAMLCRQPVKWDGHMALDFKPARIAEVREALQDAGNM
jgi:hypothetical protein